MAQVTQTIAERAKATEEYNAMIKDKQQNEEVQTVKANVNENIEISEFDVDHAHIKVVTRTPIPGKKDYANHEKIIKLNKSTFDRVIAGKSNMFKASSFDGYEIVHNPWAKGTKKEIKEQNRQAIETLGLPHIDKAKIEAEYKKVMDLEEIPEGTTVEEMQADIEAMAPAKATKNPKNK